MGMFGLTKRDLSILGRFNKIEFVQDSGCENIRQLAIQLVSRRVERGLYVLEFAPGDRDGVMVGMCKACVNGLCVVHDNVPGPCDRLEVNSNRCWEIYRKRVLFEGL